MFKDQLDNTNGNGNGNGNGSEDGREGRYSQLASGIMDTVGADTVCVVVGGGTIGNGFAVLVDAEGVPELAGILREIADQLEHGAAVAPRVCVMPEKTNGHTN